ncbi:MFS transporter [Paenibacillus lycopersici]|uniref:MFS transporter n=1 Tax=Paenibacillus lycopersici TaxID=2704462 RepID=A0A6C0FUE1_9BACL|nr:MFS transporter [Paenibacillus lycopersici]QHT60457.1 MFS transporter [Paenibacillus lycopersici]
MIPRTHHAVPSSWRRLAILLSVTLIAGFNQGLLLPLLAILLDQRGIPSDVNGLNAMALYVGTFSMMFFVERPVRKFGYKPVILTGITVTGIATMMFPLCAYLWVWFVLRLAVGIGDSALHYCTQLWIVSSSPPDKRGRYISLYGMAYGIGFSLGPTGINLTKLGSWYPFAMNLLLFAIVFLFLMALKPEYPEAAQPSAENGNRFLSVYRIAWFALLPAMLYGLLESTMNSNFPLYGLRIALSKEAISMLLPALGIGSLIVMLPLGALSDRLGRKGVLIGCAFTAGLLFFALPLAGSNLPLLFVLLALIGGLVGSFFSLGLAYAADLLPKTVLPSANVIASIHFSIGSLIGPSLSGYSMSHISVNSLFIMLGSAFMLFSATGLFFRRSKKSVAAESNLYV